MKSIEPLQSIDGGNTFASVEFDIQELILNGFEPSQQYAIRHALEDELSSILRQQSSPFESAESLEIESLNVRAPSSNLDSNPATTGNRLARALYEGLRNRNQD